VYARGVTTAPRPGSAREVFAVALRLGLTSFGGPVAHLGYFRREYVERRGWLDGNTFGDLVALSQALPGPASSQLGIAIGTRRAGVLGGLAAWLGFTAPSAALMIGLGVAATRLDIADAGWVHGLKLAAVAVVAQAVLAMARTLAPDAGRRLVALLATAAALLVASPFAQVGIIVAGAAAGLALQPALARPADVDEPRTISRRAGAAALVGFACLLVALPLLRGLDGSVALVDSFFRSGSLVFGGGHVVLPLLQANVVGPGWLSDDAFIAGYGAAQAVPGPLFTFSGYLGAVSSAGPGGVAGGLLALAAIFAPSFLLVFGVLPFWDRVRASARARHALAGSNAAVVGLLAAAMYSPVWTSAVSRPADVAVAACGLGLLLTRRVPPIVVVAFAAAAGQALALAG
jgi:chromate transporter